MKYEVRAINYGSQDYPGPAVFWFSKWFEWIYLEFYFWLVQSEDHTVLVDVGMSQEHADRANPVIQQLVGERGAIRISRDPISALKEYGVAPEDVDVVILSHTHLDHVCNVAKFPKATFVTSKKGFEWVLNPPHRSLVNPVAVPEDAISHLAGPVANAGRLKLTEDREEVLPGITTVRTGGHSFDHQSVFIDTSAGRVALIVDNGILYENLETGRPVGSPFDVVAALDAMEDATREADIVIPGHDPDVLRRYPGGLIQ